MKNSHRDETHEQVPTAAEVQSIPLKKVRITLGFLYPTVYVADVMILSI